MVLVILAAGLGTRYGGLKQLDVVSDNNESIIDFSLFDAIKAGFSKVVFIVRENILEQMKSAFTQKLKGKIKIDFVCQEIHKIPSEFKNNMRVKPWGTAHALLMAQNIVTENFCVMNADDFYGREAFFKIATFLKAIPKESNQYAMVGFPIENTLSENGIVSRGTCSVDSQSFLQAVHERTGICKKGNKILYNSNNQDIELRKNTTVSMNFWGFTPQIFTEIESQFYTFLKENYQEEEKEFYLPTVVHNLIEHKKARVKVLETTANWMGVTYREDKQNVVDKIKILKENKDYPYKLWN